MSTAVGFTRRVESFRCARCGETVAGDGYTNHCPRCLWSKHVDVAPGDRRASCDGLMRPVAVRAVRAGFTIYHRCEACGDVRRNRAAAADRRDALIALTANVIQEKVI